MPLYNPHSDAQNTVTITVPSTVVVGDLVYITGSNVGALADISDALKMPAVGTVTSKLDSTTAVVQCNGVVSDIYSGLTPGKTYFVGGDGRPNVAAPVPGASQALFHQPFGVALSSESLLVSPSLNLVRVRGTGI
jgi:hypothetical protein